RTPGTVYKILTIAGQVFSDQPAEFSDEDSGGIVIYGRDQHPLQSSSFPKGTQHYCLKGAERVVVGGDIANAVARSLNEHHHAVIRPDARDRIESAEQAVEHGISVITHTPPVLLVGVYLGTVAHGVYVRPGGAWGEHTKIAGTTVRVKRRVRVNRCASQPVSYRPGPVQVGGGVTVGRENIPHQWTQCQDQRVG